MRGGKWTAGAFLLTNWKALRTSIEFALGVCFKSHLEWKLSTRALLHYTEGLVPRTAIAKATGINVQQLTHYASGWRHPRPEMQKRILDGIHKIGNELIAIS